MNKGWKEYKLIEIGEIITGSTPSTKNNFFWNGDYPFYTPGDLGGTKMIHETEKTITKEGLKNGRAILTNAVLVTCIGSTIGKICISGEKGLTNQQINSIIVYSDYNYEFVYYLLLFKKNKFKNIAPQTAVPILNKTDFSDFKFNLPPLPQQKKIAKILSTVDNVIEQTESAIAKYQAMKQGMMHDLFTRGIDVDTGKLRPTPEDSPELYKDSVLGVIPKEWEVKELRGLTNKIVDGTHFTPNYTESGIPFLRVTDIQTNRIEFERIKYVSKKEHNELIKRCNPERGDILYSKNGTIGIPKLVDWDWEFSIFVSLALIKPKKEIINAEYLLQLLPEEIIWKQIRQRTKQGTVTNLHLEEVREFLIPVPNKKEQETICKRGVIIKNKIQAEQQTLAKYQLIKKGLMQDLLTGKVEVSVEEEIRKNFRGHNEFS